MDTSELLEDVHRTAIVRSEWRKVMERIQSYLLAEVSDIEALASRHDHSRQAFVAALGDDLATTIGLVGRRKTVVVQATITTGGSGNSSDESGKKGGGKNSKTTAKKRRDGISINDSIEKMNSASTNNNKADVIPPMSPKKNGDQVGETAGGNEDSLMKKIDGNFSFFSKALMMRNVSQLRSMRSDAADNNIAVEDGNELDKSQRNDGAVASKGKTPQGRSKARSDSEDDETVISATSSTTIAGNPAAANPPQQHFSKPYLLEEPYMEAHEKVQLVDECLQVAAKAVDNRAHVTGLLSQAEYSAYSDLLTSFYREALENMTITRLIDGQSDTNRKHVAMTGGAVGIAGYKAPKRTVSDEGQIGIAYRDKSISDTASETIVALAQRKGFDCVGTSLGAAARGGRKEKSRYATDDDVNDDSYDQHHVNNRINGGGYGANWLFQSASLPNLSRIFDDDISRLGSRPLSKDAVHWLSQRLVGRQIPPQLRRSIWIKRLLSDVVGDADDDDDDDVGDGGDEIETAGSGSEKADAQQVNHQFARNKIAKDIENDSKYSKKKGTTKRRGEQHQPQQQQQQQQQQQTNRRRLLLRPRRRESDGGAPDQSADGRRRTYEVSRIMARLASELAIADFTNGPIIKLAWQLFTKKALDAFQWFGRQSGEPHAAELENDGGGDDGGGGGGGGGDYVGGGGGGGGVGRGGGGDGGRDEDIKTTTKKKKVKLTARQQHWRMMCEKGAMAINQHYVFSGELKRRHVSLVLPLAYVIHGCYSYCGTVEEIDDYLLALKRKRKQRAVVAGEEEEEEDEGEGEEEEEEEEEEEDDDKYSKEGNSTIENGNKLGGMTADSQDDDKTQRRRRANRSRGSGEEALLKSDKHWALSDSALLAMLDSLITNFVPDPGRVADAAYVILERIDPDVYKHLRLVFPPDPMKMGGGGGGVVGSSPKKKSGVTSTMEEILKSDQDDLILTWAEDVLVGWLREDALMFVWDSFFIMDNGWQKQLPLFIADIAVMLRKDILNTSRPGMLYATALRFTRAIYTRDLRAIFRRRMNAEVEDG